jgi:hypothetical protein
METFDEVMTEQGANREFKPISGLLEKDIASPSVQPAKEPQNSKGTETVIPRMPTADSVESGGAGMAPELAWSVTSAEFDFLVLCV